MPTFFLSQEVSAAVISQWKKENLRSKLKALKDAVHEEDKAIKAQLILTVRQEHGMLCLCEVSLGLRLV